MRLGARTVQVYDGATLVTTHPRQPQGRATRLDHYPEVGLGAFLQGTPATCLRRARRPGPATAALVQALLDEPTLTRLREAQALLRLGLTTTRPSAGSARVRAGHGGGGWPVPHRARHPRARPGPPRPELEPPPPAAGAYLRGPAAFGPSDAAEEEVAAW